MECKFFFSSWQESLPFHNALIVSLVFYGIQSHNMGLCNNSSCAHFLNQNRIFDSSQDNSYVLETPIQLLRLKLSLKYI